MELTWCCLASTCPYSVVLVYLFTINVEKGEWRHLYVHSLRIHVYNSKTHKIRRKLKTKYIDNKNKFKNSDQYLVYKPRLTLPKEFLNENNDLKLTMLGGRLFQTLMIRSLKKVFSHVNTAMVDDGYYHRYQKIIKRIIVLKTF